MEDLGYHTVWHLQRHAAVTCTAIVATVLLIYRSGISLSDLTSKSGWLREEILMRGASVAYEGTHDLLVRDALKLLNNLVSEERHKTYVPKISSEKDQRNLLVLSNYKNNLLHLFVSEG